MIREVPQYLAREISNAPSVVIEDTPRRTAAGFWNLMARNFARTEEVIANQAERKYALSLDAVRKQEINRIESEYQGEPEAMQKAFIANKEGMIGAIESAEMKEKFAIAYDLEILPSLNRAVAAKTKRLDEETTIGASQSINVATEDMIKNTDGIFSSDPQMMQASGAAIQRDLIAIRKALVTRKSDGSYALSSEQVAKGMQPYLNSLVKGLAVQYVKTAEDKAKALESLDRGEVTFALPGDDGASIDVPLFQIADDDGKVAARRAVEAYINDEKFNAAFRVRQMEERYKDERADFDIRSSRGEVTYQDIETMYSEGKISDAERVQYIKAKDKHLTDNKSDPAAYAQAVQDIASGKITSSEQIVHLMGTLKVSVEDGNKLIGLLKTRNSASFDVLNGALKQVDKSMQKGLLGSYTSADAEKIQSVKNILLREYDDLIAKGASLEEIRDAFTPDKVRRVIDTNKPTITETIRAKIGQISNDSSDKDKRLPNETIADWRKRTGK